MFCYFLNVVHSLEPGETPSYSASTRLQYMYNVNKYSKTWWENDDISIYRYRTGTGNKLNLIMRMTVHPSQKPNTHYKPIYEIDTFTNEGNFNEIMIILWLWINILFESMLNIILHQSSDCLNTPSRLWSHLFCRRYRKNVSRPNLRCVEKV